MHPIIAIELAHRHQQELRAQAARALIARHARRTLGRTRRRPPGLIGWLRRARRRLPVPRDAAPVLLPQSDAA